MEEQIQPEQDVASQVETPNLLPKNWYKIGFLVIFGLIVAGGLIYAGMTFSKKQSPSTIPPQSGFPTSIPTKVSSTTPIPAETTGWKTYSGRLFTFKYPPEWKVSNVTKANPDDAILESEDSLLSFSINLNMAGIGYDCLDPSKQTVEIIFNGKKSNVEIYKGSASEICGNVEDRRIQFGEKYANNSYSFFFGYKSKVEKTSIDTLNQILSAFKFLEQSSVSVTKIPNNIPAGWLTQTNSSKIFQISYDPAKYDVNAPINGSINIIRKNIENNQNYSPYGNTTNFVIHPYDNGSRHLFIEKQLGEPISSSNKLDSYKETEYVISGNKCLIIDGISVSQFPTIWGMCPISTSQALLITTFDADFISYFKTLKFF